MSNFTGFVCWQPEHLQDVLKVEAERPSNAVFLATHQPTVLNRSLSYTAQDWQAYSEKDFLREVLDPNRDFLFVPVIGDSGTGKSHLVRWLGAVITADEHPGLRIVRIPKHHTNLRSVIGLILEGLNGVRFEQFRQRLDMAVENLSVAEGRIQLLAKLEYLIGPDGPKDPVVSNGKALTDQELAYYARELPPFLTEPIVREALLAEGSVVDRFVREALEGRAADKDTPHQFQLMDLPLDITNTHEINERVRGFFKQLSSRPKVQEHVLALLNQHLPAALRALYSLGGNDLIDLIRDVRRELRRQDQQLLLLIEDFALLQGIQGQLLEALIDTSSDDLCVLRTVLAVTRGYFDRMDTVHTRLSFIVNLNVPSDKVSNEQKLAFVGAYLNAVRVGRGALEAHASGGQIPNACASCPMQPECHPAFQATPVLGQKVGYGFYPLNANAVLHLIDLVSPQEFNPRAVLRDALWHTLTTAQRALPLRQFPDAKFRQAFRRDRLIPLDTDTLMRKFPKDEAERMSSVLNLYSVAPGVRPGLIALPLGMRDAFDLRDIPGLVIDLTPNPDPDPTPDPEPEPELTPNPDPDPTPDPEPEPNDPLTRWVQNEALPQIVATDLRRLVFSAVTAHIDWEAHLLQARFFMDERLWSTSSVTFKGQTSESGANRDAVTLPLPLPGQTRAGCAVALHGILQFQALGHWAFPNGEQHLLAWKQHVRAWSEHVLQALLPVSLGGTQEDAIPALMEGLYWSAAVHGLGSSSPTVERELQGLFDLPPRVSDDKKGPLWKRLTTATTGNLDAYRAAVLARTGVTKQSVSLTGADEGGGGRARTDTWSPWNQGGVRMIDAAVVWPALMTTRVTPSARAGEVHRDRRDLSAARKKLFEDIGPALNESNSRASALLSKFKVWVPEGLSANQWVLIHNKVLQGFTDMANVGTLRPYTIMQLTERLTVIEERDLPKLLAELRAITEASTLAHRLHHVAQWNATPASIAAEELQDIDRAITESHKAAQHRLDAETFGQGTEKLRQDLEGELIRMKDLLGELTPVKA